MLRAFVVIMLVILVASAYLAMEFIREDADSELEDVRVEAEGDDRGEATRVGPGVVPEDRMVADEKQDPSSPNEAADDSPTGRVVVGRVVDETGEPLADTEVWIESASGSPFAFGLNERSRRKATTGRDGRFLIDDVEHGARQAVVTWPPRHRRGREAFDFVEGDSFDVGDLIVRRGASLTGRVTDPGGLPVVGAAVSATAKPEGATRFQILIAGRDRWARTARTDANGRYELFGLEPGKQSVDVSAVGFPVERRLEAQVSLDGPVRELDVQLKPGRTIRGRVVDDEGNPVPEADVTCRDMGAFMALPNRDGGDDAVQSGANGEFTLVGLPRKDVRLVVSKPGYLPLAGRVVAADEETAVLTVLRAPVLCGHVIEIDTKRPITDFEVELRSKRGFTSGTEDVEIVRGPRTAEFGLDGAPNSFVVHGLTDNDCKLDIKSAGMATLALAYEDLESGARVEIEAILRPEVPFAGVVIDEAGEPVEGAVVVMRPAEGDGDSEVARFELALTALSGSSGSDLAERIRARSERHRAKTDAEGRFVFAGLAAGAYELEARHRLFLPLKGEQVKLVAGTAIVDHAVILSRGAVLQGTVLDGDGLPVVGAKIRLGAEKQETANDGAESEVRRALTMIGGNGKIRTVTRAVSGAKGRFELTGLAPGDYLVIADRPDEGSSRRVFVSVLGGGSKWEGATPVSLEAGATRDVELRLVKKARVVGRITSGGSPVSGAVVTARRNEESSSFVFGGPRAVSGADGRFAIDGLDAGSFDVNVSYEGSPFRTSETVEVKAEVDSSIDFELPAGSISGVVTDGEGNPLAGAKVSADRIAEEGEEKKEATPETAVSVFLTDGSSRASGDGIRLLTGSAPGQATTDQSGRYVIPYVEAGAYRVRAKRSGHREGERERVELGRDARVTGIDFSLGAACRLTVRAEGGSERSFFRAWARRVGADENDRKRKFFAGNGSAIFGDLEPGEYVIGCTMTQTSLSGVRGVPGSENDQSKEETVTLEVGVPRSLTFRF